MLASRYYRGAGACKYENWWRTQKYLVNWLPPLFVLQIGKDLCNDGAPSCPSFTCWLSTKQLIKVKPFALHLTFQFSNWRLYGANMRRTYWTDQNATLLFTPRLKVLWARDGFWKIALALSFHIGQVGWRLRWYPLSSPSLHQFSYCRPRVPGWRTSNTPENTSQTPQRIPPNAFHIFLIILSVVTPLLKVCCSCKKYLILGRSTISFGSYLNLFSSKKWTTQAAFLSLR